MDEKAAKKFLVKAAAPRLRDLHQFLAVATEWDVSALEASIAAWLEESKLELKDIGQPLRVALTGRTASPSLFEVLAILGRDTSLARLERAAIYADGS
jgi:glutamyl-tRNA synthetase